MCHQGTVDGALRVGGLGRLPSLLLDWGVRRGGGLTVVLEAQGGPVLLRRVVEDRRYTQLHLEVQKVVPGVLEEQILKGGREAGKRESSPLLWIQ